MAWWAGQHSRQHGYGKGRNHKRAKDERRAAEDRTLCGLCRNDAVRFGMCSDCVAEIYGQEL